MNNKISIKEAFLNLVLGYKSITRSFIMLNTMMKNAHRIFLIFWFFFEIMVADHGIYGLDLRRVIKIIKKLVFVFRNSIYHDEASS